MSRAEAAHTIRGVKSASWPAPSPHARVVCEACLKAMKVMLSSSMLVYSAAMCFLADVRATTPLSKVLCVVEGCQAGYRNADIARVLDCLQARLFLCTPTHAQYSPSLESINPRNEAASIIGAAGMLGWFILSLFSRPTEAARSTSQTGETVQY